MVQLTPGADAQPAVEQTTKRAPAAAAATMPGEFESVDQLGLDNPADEPATPSHAETFPPSPTESLGHKLAIAIGAGGAAVCLLGGITFFIMGRGEPEVALVSDAPPITDEEPEAASTAKAVVEPKPQLMSESEPESEPLEPAPKIEPPGLPDLPPVNLPEPQPEPQPKPTELPETNDPPRGDHAPAIDPLDFDPAKIDLVLLRGDRKPAGENAGDEPGESAPTSELPQDKEATPADQERQRLASLDRRLAERAEVEGIWVERAPTAFEPHQPVDLARRLSEQIPEFVLPAAPLADAIRLWSELASVPVTIDPSALSQAGVSTRTKMTLRGINATLGQMLLDGLKPLRLTFVEGKGEVVLALQGGQNARSAEKDYADLLAPGSADANALQQLASVMALAPSEAQALAVEGTRLRTNSTVAAHHDLTIFCERLRRARALPQQTKYPAALLPVQPSLKALEPVLAGSTTFTFITPTPLTDIFAHWREASGLEVLVDWGSVAQAKLGPRSLVRCSVRDQSWRDAIEGVLTPLGLAWQAVDSHTIQIASRADARHTHESLEFYPLAQARTGDQIAQRLQDETAGLKSRTALRFDTPSGALLVRTCGANQQFVYDWLQRNGLLRE